jgi:hypothetical protein
MDLFASGYKPLTPEERFWSNVDKESDGKCWLWTGKTNDAGYGIFTVGNRQSRAHRIAWQLHHARQVPEGMLIRHRCDVRACVNPEHLVAGSHSDNNADAVRRQRRSAVKGEASPNAKLTAEKVQWARQQWESGLATKAELARQLNVGPTTIHAALLRQSWAHVK